MSKVVNPISGRKIAVGGILHKRLCKDINIKIAGCKSKKKEKPKKSVIKYESKEEQEKIEDLNRFFDNMFASEPRYQKNKKVIAKSKKIIKSEPKPKSKKIIKPKKEKTIKIKIVKNKPSKKKEKSTFITAAYNHCLVGMEHRPSGNYNVDFYNGITDKEKNNIKKTQTFTQKDFKGYPSVNQTFEELKRANINAKYLIILGHGGNVANSRGSGTCKTDATGTGTMPETTKIYLISKKKVVVDFKEKQDVWSPFGINNIKKFIDNGWRLLDWQKQLLRLDFPIVNKHK